jgi:DNA invertase Pin-like site-specific DNA recombinase
VQTWLLTDIRTSTRDQHLDRGIHEIQEFCKEHELKLENIFTDQQTGKNFDRPRYTVLVEDVLRKNDTMIVTELDRLGRNKRDTMEQIRKLQGMDVRLMVLELPTTLMDLSKMDNSMARLMMETINNMMLELYASISESELQKKEKRQLEGIAMKKLRGEWDDYGRPPAIKEEAFDEAYKRVTAGEITQAELKKELGLSHSTFYRYRKKYFEKNQEIFQSQES